MGTLMLPELREQVWRANQAIVAAGLVTLSFGNASGVDRAAGVMLIKPSGVPYDDLRPEDLVAVVARGRRGRRGRLRPSSDTPTHLALYRRFADDRRRRPHPLDRGRRHGRRPAGRSRLWGRPTPTTSAAPCR